MRRTHRPRGHRAAACAPGTAGPGDGTLAGALLALAAGLLLNSLLGPLGVGAIDCPVPAHGAIMSQLLALDAFAGAVVVPVALASALLVLRRHPLGPVVAMAPAVYTAYMAPQYVLGPSYLHHDGNSEAFFPLHLVLFVLGWTTSAVAWRRMDPTDWPPLGRLERRVGGALIPALAVATFARYVPAVIAVAAGHPSTADYREGPGYFWSLALLDLGVGLPAALAAAVGLRRGSPWGRRTALTLAGWPALVGPAVGAMAISSWIRDAPGASAAQAAAMAVLGLLYAGLAIILLSRLHPAPSRAVATPSP